MQRGLAVISSRADSLARFVESYSKLARLPPPRLEPLKIGALVSRVARLETRLPVNVVSGPDLVVQGDDVQLEQLLINLVRNAVDASMETRGGVDIGWQQKNGQVEVWVRDEGPGSRAPRICLCRSLRRSRRGRGLGWCCRGRLPKRTVGR
jgi:C4-dicarboxylate-specific signal transduction histidine kinase